MMILGPRNAVWHGTDPDDAVELRAAIDRHCDCHRDSYGRLIGLCAPHRMAYQDQRALDGLLVFRHLAGRLVESEHVVAGLDDGDDDPDSWRIPA